jgi:hypothetical protein
MKTILKITLIFSLFLIVASNAKAQEETTHKTHHHGWHISDSTSMSDFSCFKNDFNMDEFPFCKHKSKYNGHWAGIELGVSGYATPQFDMNFSRAYPFMNMNTARSLTVNINPFELNVNLCHNHFGFTTGLGLQISNYYFTNDYVMLKDSAELVAYKVQDSQGNLVSMKVNKMVVSTVTLPLLFEYQTNHYRRLNSFHITLGVIAGLRIGSYTKQVYNDKDESYFLVDANGDKIATFDVEHYTVRDRGAYHLNPFRLDAAFRIGWSHLNIFSTYSVTKMFQKNQGPELYPFTVGITLLGW